MRRLRIILLLTLATVLSATAQNNRYNLDDQCYPLYVKADNLVGTDEFEEANQALLRMAIQRKDEKARTLAYVNKLHHEQIIIASEEAVLKAFNELKAVARETGYKQYYYHGYRLVGNYYYYKKKYQEQTKLLLEMRNTALEANDEYGTWVSDKYISDLYLAQSDYISAKKYFPEYFEIYENTSDPTIRGQIIATALLDYSDCFPVGSDSMRLFLSEARSGARGGLDSVRCDTYSAVLALLDRNMDRYAFLRDKALASPKARFLSKTLPEFFSYTDAISKGKSAGMAPPENVVVTLRELRMLCAVAESFGDYRIAFGLQKFLTERMEYKLSGVNEMNLSELEARYGNDILSRELETQSLRAQRITRIATMLILVILLIIIIFMVLQIRTLRRARRRDEKRIDELTAANEKARIADEAKTRFLQNMTHELRTPLNAITGFSQLLSLPDGMFSPEEKEEFGDHIINNTKMLTMLLDDIMHTSAMDGGSYSVNIEDAECEHICRQALRSAEHRLQPGVSLQFVPDMPLPYHFRTDPLRVQQVLTNILTNACKHTAEGEVRLCCSLTENPGMLTFAVEDTGPGVPAKEAERIFGRFVKLNEFVQGTGLGLSICRDIADRLGGTIRLDTGYTSGARFVFTVPVE